MNWGWIGANAGQIGAHVLQHVAQTAPAIVIGFLISLPLGYLSSRSRALRSVLLVVFNIVYTIPAIALLVFVPVALNGPILDPTNLVIALTLYALAVMVRSASDAFASVPADIRASATAMGYSAVQRFFAVELPLAGPVLLAGIRVVSVSTVSLASVGAITGIQNLGFYFTDAFQRQFLTEAIVGIVAVLVLAAVFDIVLSLLGRLLMPWTRAAGRRRSLAASRVVVTP